MRVSAWTQFGKYGIRLRLSDRRDHIDRRWTSIDIELDGELHRFRLTPSFWKHKRPIEGKPFRPWFEKRGLVTWPNSESPKLELVELMVPLDTRRRFRLLG